MSQTSHINAMAQPRRTCSPIVFTDGIYICRDRAGKACEAVGAYSTSPGTLMVHYADDYDAAGGKVYTALDLTAAQERGALFDEVKETGTTVVVANVQLYAGENVKR